MWHNALETKILFTGKDATIPFDESGHSATAIAEMENYVIGVIGTEEKNETDPTQEGNTIENDVPEGNKEEEKPALENEAEENSETDVPEGNKTYVLEDNDISANESDDAPVEKDNISKIAEEQSILRPAKHSQINWGLICTGTLAVGLISFVLYKNRTQ